MTQTIVVYKEQTVGGKTVFNEAARYEVSTATTTPVYIDENNNLVITTTEGEVKVDKDSIIEVTPEVLERVGIKSLEIPKTEGPTDTLLDKDGYALFDVNNVQIRVKES